MGTMEYKQVVKQGELSDTCILSPCSGPRPDTSYWGGVARGGACGGIP